MWSVIDVILRLSEISGIQYKPYFNIIVFKHLSKTYQNQMYSFDKIVLNIVEIIQNVVSIV